MAVAASALVLCVGLGLAWPQSGTEMAVIGWLLTAVGALGVVVNLHLLRWAR